MAKKAKAKSLITWEDINEYLRQMNAMALEQKQIAIELNPQIVALQEQLKSALAPLNEKMEELEAAVTDFALSHKDDFVTSKTMDLANGKVALRTTTALVIADEVKTITELQKRGFVDCIKETLKPIKKVIQETLPPADLAKCGCEVVTSDSVKITLL